MHFPKRHPHGNTPMFPAEGEVALMFLKPYTGLLDDGLIEMLNGSIHMQMFCGVMIDPSKPLKKTCKQLKERHPRNKYHDIDRARLAYANNANRRYCSGSDKNAELEEIGYSFTSEGESVRPKSSGKTGFMP